VFQALYRMVFNGYYVRRLEKEIQARTHLPFLNHEEAGARALFSLRGGSSSFLMTYALLSFVGAFLYCAIVGFCFTRLDRNPLNLPMADIELSRQALFLLVQGSLLLAMAHTLLGVFKGFGQRIDPWLEPDFARPVVTQRIGGLTTVRYAMLPRTFDVFFKSSITLAAFLLTTYAFHVSPSKHWVTSFLLTWLCVDFLAKQSTYIWNDVVDYDRDAKHPHKPRFRLHTFATRSARKRMFGARTLATVAVAILAAAETGYWWLPALVAAIYSWQIVYHLTKTDQLSNSWQAALKLAVCSGGYSERSVAGGCAALSVAASQNLAKDVAFLSALAIFAVTFAVVFMSAYWLAEDTFLKRAYALQDLKQSRGIDCGSTPPLKEPNDFFINHGARIEYLANFAMVPAAFVLSAVVTPEWWRAWPLAFIGLAVVVGTRWLVARATALRGPLIFIVVVTVVPAMRALPQWRVALVAVGISVVVGILYESLTYEEIALVDLKRGLLGLLVAADRLIFGSTTAPSTKTSDGSLEALAEVACPEQPLVAVFAPDAKSAAMRNVNEAARPTQISQALTRFRESGWSAEGRLSAAREILLSCPTEWMGMEECFVFEDSVSSSSTEARGWLSRTAIRNCCELLSSGMVRAAPHRCRSSRP